MILDAKWFTGWAVSFGLGTAVREGPLSGDEETVVLPKAIGQNSAQQADLHNHNPIWLMSGRLKLKGLLLGRESYAS